MEREDFQRKNIESQLHPLPLQIPPPSPESMQRQKRSFLPRPKPLSFAATNLSQPENILRRSKTSHGSISQSYEKGAYGKSQSLPRNASSAPIKLGITNSYHESSGNLRDDSTSRKSGSMIMDDSLFDDDSVDADPARKSNDEMHHNRSSKSYNDVILSRWTPPMCYSKKKAQDHFLYQRNHHSSQEPTSLSPPGSAPQLDSFLVNKSALKNPGKTFEQIDYEIFKKRRKPRPSTTSAI